MFLIRNNKAQASAPFELLVAVVIMGFVILAGTYALQSLSENTCIGQKRQDMSNLVSSLADVVLGPDLVFKNINFSTKACYNQKYETIKLTTYTDPIRCASICGGGSTCTLLEYRYSKPDRQGHLITKMPIEPICTNLPSSVVFASNLDDCGLDDPNNSNYGKYVIKDPTENIPPGKYLVFRVSAETPYDVQKKICFLKQERTNINTNINNS